MIIFDWDGTLINSIDWITHCLQHAAAQYDCPIPESQAAKDVIGLSINKAMQTLFPEVDEQTQEQLVACYSQTIFFETTQQRGFVSRRIRDVSTTQRDGLSTGCCDR